MNFLLFPLGSQPGGAAVVVTLRGAASDVFLVDDVNLARFRGGTSFSYVGGHATSSPVRLGVPHAGSWNAVVVPANGKVEASVTVVPS